MLEQLLGDSYAAYETFQDALSGLEMEQEWQWYTPYKAWFAKGQHFWVTPRGARKEKNLYWLYFYEGYFSVAVWFKEKNRAEVLSADVSDKTKTLIQPFPAPDECVMVKFLTNAGKSVTGAAVFPPEFH